MSPRPSGTRPSTGARLAFVDHHSYPDPEHPSLRIIAAEILDRGEKKRIEGKGTGPIDGFVHALSIYLGIDLTVSDYSEHTLQHGSDASAICYMQVEHPKGKLYGVGITIVEHVATLGIEPAF